MQKKIDSASHFSVHFFLNQNVCCFVNLWFTVITFENLICSKMALESFLGLDVNEKFQPRRKRVADLSGNEALEEFHPTCLSLPQMPLNLNSLTDANDPARKIAMKFAKGTTTLSFVYQGGIVVCADSRATGGQYIGSQSVKKIIVINDYLVGTMAGGAADCMYWQRVLSEHCRMFELRNKERISVAAASKLLGNILYNYKGYVIVLALFTVIY